MHRGEDEENQPPSDLGYQCFQLPGQRMVKPVDGPSVGDRQKAQACCSAAESRRPLMSDGSGEGLRGMNSLSKFVCPCCHTHSRLVLKSTIHSGFNSTVLCCARRDIEEQESPITSTETSPSVQPMIGEKESMVMQFQPLGDPIESWEMRRKSDRAIHGARESASPLASGLLCPPSGGPPQPGPSHSGLSHSASESSIASAVSYVRMTSCDAKEMAAEHRKRFKQSDREGIGKSRYQDDPWRRVKSVRDVVIKIVKKKEMEESVLRKVFREVGLLEMLDHPNIMPILSSVETEAELWMFFEHAELEDLHKMTRYQRLSEGDTREICRQLLPAIEYLHRKRVVHCDIKPQNVLLSFRDDLSPAVIERLNQAARDTPPPPVIPLSPVEKLQRMKQAKAQENAVEEKSASSQCLCSVSSVWQAADCFLCDERRCCGGSPTGGLGETESRRPRVVVSSSPGEDSWRSGQFRPTLKELAMTDLRLRICDFGLAQSLGENGKIDFDGVRGTSGFIAPEILNRHDYDEKVDIWAFGSLICRMLTAQEPFYPPYSCRTEDMQFHPSLWQGLSHEVKDFVAQLLCRDPSKRLSATEAMRHSWMLIQD